MKFIRAFWGDTNTRNHERVRADADRFETMPEREMECGENCVVYCFGVENEKLFRERGHETRLLSKEPIAHDYGSGPNWTHKVDAIDAAHEEFGDIIWMDWDMRQLKPLDFAFWELLNSGPHFQSGLTRYVNDYANWRDDKRLMPGGGWVYWRAGDASRQIIELVKSFMPTTLNRLGEKHYHDEFAMSMAIEELHGGWQGVEWWNDNWQPSVLYHPRGAIRSSRKKGGKYFQTH